MKGRCRFLLAGFGVLLVAVFAGVTLGNGRARAADVPDGHSEAVGAVSDEQMAAARASVLREEEHSRELESPEAKATKAESQTKFRGLTDAEALDLAKSRFGGLIASPAWSSPLKDGERIATFFSDEQVAVDSGHGEPPAMLTSQWPLRSETDSGRKAPTDLRLQDTGANLEPANAATAVEIPKQLGDNVAFPDAHVEFRPLGTASSSDERAVAGKVFYGNVKSDTDFVVAPTPVGVETLTQLRSKDSPEEQGFSFKVPDGAEVKLVDGGRGGAEVVRGDQVLTTVSPASATDAQGRSVPVSYALDGTTLKMRVEHQGGEYAYPIMVDPTMTVDDRYWDSDPSKGFGGWEFATNNAYVFGNGQAGWWGRGLYLNVGANTTPANGNYGEWFWQAAPTTRIYRADFGHVFHAPSSSNASTPMCMTEGVWTDATWTWETGGVWANSLAGTNHPSPRTVCNGSTEALTSDYAWHCLDSVACGPTTPSGAPVGKPGNIAVFEQWANGTSKRTGADFNFMGGAFILVSDSEPPTLNGVTHSGLPSGWADSATPSVTPSATDSGTGVKSLVLHVPGQPDQTYTYPCDGGKKYACPASWNTDPAKRTANNTFTYKSDATPANGSTPAIPEMPEGINDVSVGALDGAGSAAATIPASHWNVKIDRSAPAVTLSGALKDKANDVISDGSYDLQASATDGDATSNATARAGVKSIEFQVDGKRTNYSAQTCAAGNCAMTRSWTLRGEDLSDGEHTITVLTHDQIGHESSQSFTVTTHHADSITIAPGTVNPITGDFSVDRTDATIDSPGAALTFSRTYHSRGEGNVESGPLGPGWTLSTPVEEANSAWVSLSVASAGSSVDLGGSDGSHTTFARNANGQYGSATSPELRIESTTDGKYLLHDDSGDTTTFARPAGSAGPYLPIKVTQAAASTDTSYEYVNVGGTFRVSRELAPAPAGVNCGNGGAPGCRSLTFSYASSTTATGDTSAQWGDFVGQLGEVQLTAYDPTSAQMKSWSVARYSYDAAGRLRAEWDPRVVPALKESYDYTPTGRLSTLRQAGLAPWSVAYATTPGDSGEGRLANVSRATPQGTATWTMAYDVPLSGSAAPYKMGAADVAAWSQQDAPVAAAALFPPTDLPASPPNAYSKSAVTYVDSKGRVVNKALPGGRISTTEYDARDHPVRQLTAANRVRALDAGAQSQTRAAALDEERTYSADGRDLVSELGPSHDVQLQSGERVQARQHTATAYDENGPSGSHYGLPTTVTESAQVAGRSDADATVTKTSYDGQAGLGWTLRAATSTTTDAGPGGLNLQRQVRYDASSGLATETSSPASPVAGGDAHTKRTIYYSAGSSQDPTCANKPEWANLPCMTLPAAQPGTAGMPALPVASYTYNALDQQAVMRETVGSSVRVTTTERDDAGRTTSTSVSASGKPAVPRVDTAYDAATGLPATTTNVADNGASTAITKSYDSLGRIIAYTDADGATTTTAYDLSDRPTVTSDAKGSQTKSYDPVTGDLISLQDSAAGAFTATYDAGGNELSVNYPNGLTRTTRVDETGAATSLQYSKAASCGGDCAWYSDSATRSIHDQRLHEVSSTGTHDNRFDGAGRLVEVRETPTGQGCTTRRYTLDADSNRVSSSSQGPALDGSCSSGAGVPTSHVYDSSDRLNDPGVSYDDYGNTTQLPASDAGGSPLVSTYGPNNALIGQSQDGVVLAYTLDPTQRTRTRTATGSASGFEVSHYGDDSDRASWTETDTLGGWSRDITGIDGDLAGSVVAGRPVTFAVANLHGDIVAHASQDPAATSLLQRGEFDEAGVPAGGQRAGRFAWLGAKSRRSELASGVMQMGERAYVPAIGRFEQPDPVEGGSASSYDYANADPIDQVDLDGRQGYAPQSCDLYSEMYLTRELFHRFGVAFHADVFCTQKTSYKLSMYISRSRFPWDASVARYQTRLYRKNFSHTLYAGHYCRPRALYNGNAYVNIISSGNANGTTIHARSRIRCA